MASTFTPRYPLAQQDGLPELLHQLPAHLEGASLESLEQETRHALKRLAVAVSLEDVVLLTFDLEQRTPRATRIVGANGTIPEHVAALISHKWLLDRIAGDTAAVHVAPRDPASDAPAAELQQLWDHGTCAVVVAPWKTSEDKPAGSILCFQGRTHEPSLVEHESLLIAFARRLGSVVLGGAPARDALEGDRSPRERPLLPLPRTPGPATSPEDGIIGESVCWRYVMFRVEQVADTQATVLLLGETGTGKELVARAIHRRSTRRHNRFVALNCSALPATLIESELFGRERGAFTGANVSQAGRFELAHRGTLFLDEVGDLPLELQPKLLRVLQEGQLDRLGSTHPTNIDVRVIAATNRDLASDVRNERFRRDLYYRLNVFPITLPSLRERPDDIPQLAAHILNRFSKQLRKSVEPFSKGVLRLLQDHHWPGNIRELENVIQRAIILSSGGVISENDICLSGISDVTGIVPQGAQTSLEAVEREHILRILATTSWRIEGPKGAARALGLKPSTLRSRLQKLAIRRAS